MKANLKAIRVAIATGLLSLGVVTAAHAVPTLTLTSGATTIVITDGSALDGTSAVPGEISYNGAVGSNFFITLDMGSTKPYTGTSQVPYLQLTSTAFSMGAGTLTITFSDTDFGPGGGAFRSTLSGLVAGGGSADFKTYDDAANTLGAQTTLLTSLSGTGSLNATAASNGFAPNSLYSLTEVLTITHTAGGNTTVGATTTVPDGGSTLTLIGLSLVAVVGVRWVLNKQAPGLL